jgi:hypothetical protein
MSGTIGYIALNNINKFPEYYLPYAMVFLGVSIFFYLKKCPKKYLRLRIKNSYFRLIISYLSTFSLIFLILSNLGLIGGLLTLSSGLLSIGILYKLNNKNNENTLFLLIPSLLLIITTITQTNSIPIILIIFAIYYFIYYKTNKEFYCLAVLIFIIKRFYVGPLIIGDAFHAAEHFLATEYISFGLFSIFPNIGYLEEAPGVILVKFLKIITFDNINISIASARTLIWIALLPIIFWYAYKRSKLLSILLILLLPIDRLSIIFALIYSIIIINSYRESKHNLFIGSLCFLPVFSLGLSPTYFLIPALSILGLLPFKKINNKNILFIFGCWIVFIILLRDDFLYFIKTYAEFSAYYDIGLSTSTFNLRLKDLVFWPIYVLAISVLLADSIYSKCSIYLSIFKYIILIAILYKFTSYGYGRIDPGFSRLISLGIPLIFIAIQLSSRFNLLSAYTLIAVLLLYSNINLTGLISKETFEFINQKNSPIQLDDNNKIIVQNINNFSNGRGVINYSMEPAITPFILNSLVPPYTSPFVTLGIRAQEKVIDFIKNNPNSIIYIGHSFITFDQVDIRLRTPIIFKYIASNYTYYNENGNIYAVPNSPKDIPYAFNLFFNGMDLKSSPIFYSRFYPKKYKYVEIDIECSDSNIYRYKLLGKNNFIYGNFSCGKNLVPEEYIWGELKGIEKVE